MISSEEQNPKRTTMLKPSDLLAQYKENLTSELNWVGSFWDYLTLVQENPLITRNSYQRIYDMIEEAGWEDRTENKKTIRHWKFFDDLPNDGKNAIYGIDGPISQLVENFKSAALGYGSAKRLFLLAGPVGSSKSSLATLLKRGLENYSRTPAGAIYTYEWESEDGWERSPMNEEPLKLLPAEIKVDFVKKLLEGKPLKYPITTHLTDLNSFCRGTLKELIAECDGNWKTALSKVRVCRFTFSEQDRVGIGTYQPKDEKSQDATELTGDINYRKLAKYGTDSSFKAFSHDGEFQKSNRGLIEFIEILKLDTAFLYDLLGAAQERKIKPRKFSQTDIDEVILGHTNIPEFKKLQSNELMEAFKDRTIKINVPYNLVLEDEVKIYRRDFTSGVKHVAPHTLRVASMWAILTRLTDPGDTKLALIQKLKLYNGKTLPGYTNDNVEELKEEGRAKHEGMFGISPRFIQDKISSSLSSTEYTHVNPFIIMNEIAEGIKQHPLISSDEQIKNYNNLLDMVRVEYEDIIKNEVQKAICADEEAIGRLCSNYIDNIKAFCQREKVRNKYTGKEEEPDEKLMRSVEEKIDIPENRKNDFRKELMNFIGALAIDGKKFEYWTNDRLNKALELKLFEDNRHTIKFSTMVNNVIDMETQQKIDVVKARLIKNYGYNEESATDVLNYVASIFSRGDPKK